MHPETTAQLRAARERNRLDNAEALDLRMARYAEAAAEREAARAAAEYEATAITQATLPAASSVDLVTMTMSELHDTIYHAVSTAMQQTSMTKRAAQTHAARAADTGQRIVRAQGWTHRGVDPRA